MAIKMGKEYLKSLKRLKPTVYVEWQRYDDKTARSVIDDPTIRPSLDTITMVYDIASNPEYVDIMTATSHLIGEKVSRFTHFKDALNLSSANLLLPDYLVPSRVLKISILKYINEYICNLVWLKSTIVVIPLVNPIAGR